jgi:hypothetical protein
MMQVEGFTWRIELVTVHCSLIFAHKFLIFSRQVLVLCFVKVLRGSLLKTRYKWPHADLNNETSEQCSQMIEIGRKVYEMDEVTYMNGTVILGLSFQYMHLKAHKNIANHTILDTFTEFILILRPSLIVRPGHTIRIFFEILS